MKNHEHKGGISKNAATNFLIDQYGGSRETYWKCIRELVDEKIIELKKVKKQQEKLFPTQSKKNLDEFNDKMKYVKNLLTVISDNPSIGDCFVIEKTNQIKISYNHLRKINHHKIAIGNLSMHESKYQLKDVFCIQARYDILHKLSVFLVHYINDSQNNYNQKNKNDMMEIIYDVISKSIITLQQDYVDSPFYTRQFTKKYSVNPKLSWIRGKSSENIAVEFLRILGRYYFTISDQLSKKGKFDSCKEQKIVTNFVKAFFPKSDIQDDSISDEIGVDEIIEYVTFIDKPRKEFFKQSVLERLDKIHDSFGGKYALKNDNYKDNDPLVITNYYNDWIFELDIFSNVEKRIIVEYLRVEQEYDDEYKKEDADTVDMDAWGDIIGKLSNHDGMASILTNYSYDEIRAHAGKKIPIQIEPVDD